MKKVLLLLTLSVFALTELRAQQTDTYKPHVLVVGLYKYHPASRDTVEHQAGRMAAMMFDRNHVEGIKQIGRPNFIMTTHNNKFALAIGGNVTLRAGYDFEGISNNTDFIPADIATTATYANRQKLFMSASTSTLYIKAIARTRLLGDIVTFVETDFRGFRGDMAMRQAYISFKGFLFGRTYTTFCDLTASPTTIDFQGPNAYNSKYNEVIRYTHHFGKHWSMAVAAETPSVNATYASGYNSSQTQRIPDFVGYVQYSWGRYQKSHLRASGVIRTMYYHNLVQNDNQRKVGYGVQLSGNIAFARHFNIFMNGVYGKGITPYLQDITGSGLDLVPNPTKEGEMQMPTMWGWFAALQYNITPRIWVSGGYSEVSVDHSNGYSAGSEYKKGQYVFANIFYKLTPNCRIALEYLYGTRKNQDGAKGHANRVQTMIQYNF
jgi:predicted porin